MADTIYLKCILTPREDTLENWKAENPILERGEPSIVRDGEDGQWLKIGDGVTRWDELPYKKGPKGDKGDDYILTEADRKEIVQSVLDAMPSGDEVKY